MTKRYQQRRAERYVKEHGLERKEDSKGLGGKIKEKLQKRYHESQEKRAFKKSPAGRRQENEMLMLEAQKEKYKTSIHKSKQSRRGDMFGGSSSTGTRRSSRRQQPRQQSSMWSSGYGHDTHSYNGMNDMLGMGGNGSKPKRSKKQPRAYSGMDDLF